MTLTLVIIDNRNAIIHEAVVANYSGPVPGKFDMIAYGDRQVLASITSVIWDFENRHIQITAKT